MLTKGGEPYSRTSEILGVRGLEIFWSPSEARRGAEAEVEAV